MEENGFSEFLLWERATLDTIDFKKVYVDMADDLVAGLLLSQIIFWFLPKKKGGSKIRVWKDGEWWLAKSYHKWEDEIRITKDQARRAIGVLCDKNLIVTARYMFNGAPTMHMRINASVFLDSWKCAVAQYQVGQDTLGSGPQPISITETTTETTTEIENGPEPKPISEHFEDVMEFLRKEPVRQTRHTATAEFCALCFGGKAEYGRVGRILKKHKYQYRRICQVALESVAKSPRGDPYSYLEACLKGGGRDAKKKQGSHVARGPKHHVADRAEFDKARREVQERKAAEAGG